MSDGLNTGYFQETVPWDPEKESTCQWEHGSGHMSMRCYSTKNQGNKGKIDIRVLSRKIWINQTIGSGKIGEPLCATKTPHATTLRKKTVVPTHT